MKYRLYYKILLVMLPMLLRELHTTWSFPLLSDNFSLLDERPGKEAFPYWLGCLSPHRLLGEPGFHCAVQTPSCRTGVDLVSP